MTIEEYLGELSSHLHVRGVAGSRIEEIVREVAAHLEESGEAPAEAFGPPEEYAEKMAVFNEHEAQRAANEAWHRRTFQATAFDEMGILRIAGRDGWELMDVGPFSLFCQRPADGSRFKRWEYMRRVGIDQIGIFEEMTADRWQPCGHWVVFHYFKREVREPSP